eukprot:g35050.t1
MLPRLKGLSYKEMLGLLSLERRRLRGDVIEVYKIMRGIDKVNNQDLFPRVGESKTRGHRFKGVSLPVNLKVLGLSHISGLDGQGRSGEICNMVRQVEGQFVNDSKTHIMGQISNNDKTEYEKEKDSIVVWCKDNNLSFNVNKTKELGIDFRRQSGGHAPVCINGADVEVVKSFKFQGVDITNDLSWSIH